MELERQKVKEQLQIRDTILDIGKRKPSHLLKATGRQRQAKDRCDQSPGQGRQIKGVTSETNTRSKGVGSRETAALWFLADTTS